MIATPDQRLRVFVSSTLEELAAERGAAREAIESLRLTPVMFELGARPHPPRELYGAYVDQSDVFVGIYGERYGWVPPEAEISGLEEEFRLARDKPQLLYVKRPAPNRDERLAALVSQIEAEGTVSYRTYSDAEELRRVLADDLALLLSERFQKRHERPARRLHVHLPAPLDRFVGREAELETLAVRLADRQTRLVTVTGAGGVGKTRAALEVAGRTASLFADGAHFVALTDVAEPQLVPALIQESLGIPAGAAPTAFEALADGLRDADLLLVLDNFEHVLDAAAAVGRLLADAPRVTVLATSRTPLKLRGEHEVPLAPLRVEADRDDSSEAAALFLERARAANPSLSLTPEDERAVAAICARLDGLPLAIELAAAQVRVLPLRTLAERLERGLDLSARGGDYPGRHRTLRAAMEWSFGLLEGAEQELLEQLGVFRGGFTFEAAEAVAGRDAFDGLAALVEASLVMRNAHEPRFSLLETVREFAADRLDERGETDAARERHAAFYLNLVDEIGERLNAPGEHAGVLETLDQEEANIRDALAWLLSNGHHDRIGRAGWSLLPYWSLRERLAEGRSWMGTVLDADDVSEHTRARALTVDAILAFWASQYPAATMAASQAAPYLREIGDDVAIALAQIPLGVVEAIGGDREAGLALLEDSGERARRVGSEWDAAMATLGLGWALNAAEAEAPLDMYEEAVARARTFGHELETLALGSLARRLSLAGETERARQVLAEVLRRVVALRVRIAIGLYTDLTADLAATSGDDAVAARLSGAASAIFEDASAPIPPLVGDRSARIRRLRERLGGAYEEESRAGAQLGLDGAGAAALDWLVTD